MQHGQQIIYAPILFPFQINLFQSVMKTSHEHVGICLCSLPEERGPVTWSRGVPLLKEDTTDSFEPCEELLQSSPKFTLAELILALQPSLPILISDSGGRCSTSSWSSIIEWFQVLSVVAKIHSTGSAFILQFVCQLLTIITSFCSSKKKVYLLQVFLKLIHTTSTSGTPISCWTNLTL